MDYTTLKTNINTTLEHGFSDAQLAKFVQQAEQKIYLAVDLPVMVNQDTTAMVSGTATWTIPTGFLSVVSFAAVNAGTYSYLLPKEESFIRAAYPAATVDGLPKHYAIVDSTTILLGPTPDAAYNVDFQYRAYPTSIVTAGTTFLGDQFDTALFNGALVEAIRENKGEQDMVDLYEKQFVEALALLKNVSDGRLQQDNYRSGRAKVVPK